MCPLHGMLSPAYYAKHLSQPAGAIAAASGQ